MSYSPGSCALGIHVLLEELGAPFELKRLNFAEREQYGEAYLVINPKSKVPTLERNDGSVLTEFQAISTYLALTHPEKRLIPTDIERQTRMIEAMDYVVGTIHGQGFRLVFRPMDYASSEADQDAIKARSMEKANRGLSLIDKDLAGKDWIVGDRSRALLRLMLGRRAAEDRPSGERAKAFRAHDGPFQREEGAQG
jgi:glutathione S-transferase